MPTGTVKFFDATKGYGFIRPDDEDRDLFIHERDLAESGLVVLERGARVRFDRVADRKMAGRFKAAKLRLLNDAPA